MIAFEKSVGAVIFRKEDSKIYYLLLDYGNEYWGLAKGHVEEGEKEIETLKREVAEETGINDLEIIGNFKETVRYSYFPKGKEKEKRHKGKTMLVFKKAVYYLAETKTKDINLSREHFGFVWLPLEDAITRITYKSPKKVLEKANKFLEKNSE